jgi:hypothetical protein
MTVIPQCFGCAHFDSASARVDYRCTAFPGGIPPVILWNKHDHRTPYPGDHGIGFKPIEPEVKTSDGSGFVVEP